MKEYQEKITVIIPVYNVEKYVAKCLDSIINQTYKNLDIIIVNDGSTDNSGKILEEYTQKDERIRLFHQENQGLSAARNTGLSKTRTALLTFVDSDDWVDKKLIEILYNDLKNYNADISSSTFLYEYQDRSKCKEIDKNGDVRVYTQTEALDSILMDKEIQSYAWAKLYKTNLFDDLKFPVGRIFEDYAFTYKVISKAKNFVKRHTPLYHYLQLQTSLSKVNGVKHNYHFLLGLFERYDFVQSNPEVVSDYKNYQNLVAKEVFFCLKRIIRLSKGSENQKEIQFVIKKIAEFLKEDTKGIKPSILLKLRTMVYFPKLYSMFLKITKKNKKTKEKLFQ